MRPNATAPIAIGGRRDFALTAAAAATIYCVPIQSELAPAELVPDRSDRIEAMIILSKLADYGVIVATHLAAHPERQETAAAIAAATRLPPATVSKLLKALAHAGLAAATRGAAGGYRLARPAAAISVAEVVAAIDGDIGMTQCSVHAADCERTSWCPTRPHWAAINRAVGTALSAISLAEMLTPFAFVPAAAAVRDPAAAGTRI